MSRHNEASSFWDEQVQTVVDSSLDPVITIDEQGVIADWNRQATTTFGWSRHEVIGRELVGLIIPKNFRDAHQNGLARYRKTGEAPVVGQRLELSAQRRDGSEFPIELCVTTLEKEGTKYFLAYVRDITDWRQRDERQSLAVLEAKLVGESAVEVAKAESFEESLQSVLDTICEQIGWPLGHVWIPNDSGTALVSSHIWHLGPGLELTEIRSSTARTRFQPGEGLPGTIWTTGSPLWFADVDAATNFPRLNACLAAGIHSVFGFPVTTRDGMQAVLEFFHTEHQPQNNDLLAIVSRLGRRIGELVQSRRFERQQARLAAIVDSSYDAIISKDLEGAITSWNGGAERIYGFSESEALGSLISIILPDDQSAEEPELLLAVQTGQRLEQFRTTRRRKDGTLIPVSLTVSPIVDASGRIVGSSTIERDISPQLRRERELQDAKLTALQANRTRGEFLANVSHELRTPMNAIIGMTQIALEEDLSEEVRDYLTTANEAAHSLLCLLNDILDFSKIESGKFIIASEPFSLAEIIDETTKIIAAQAFAQGLELVCETPSDLPQQVIGDAMRVRQVLTNLLSNAVKFTKQGEIVLRVQTIRIWPKEVCLRFSVIDTGIGIAADEQRRILEPFAQVDSSATREHGGTGLGLAICSELLRMMGGRLSLTSTPGEGSTFSFRLSFELPADATSGNVADRPLDKLQQLPVLVVDDNDTNRGMISDTLKQWSMRPTVARDANQAIEILKQTLSEGRTFPLFIVDALMPGTDGYELSNRLAQLTPDPDTPVILMVSSTDRREFRNREHEASIAAYLEKPVTRSDLMDAVMQALDVQPPEPITQTLDAPSGERMEPLSVLCAEDTPANQKVVTATLKKWGHSVSVANNGREAVERFKKEEFDVVLMDVQMPILDGFQATAAIRDFEKPSGKTTPIIAMTAHAMRGDRERCLEAGMDAYISKPIDVKQLLGLIESISEDRRSASLANAAQPLEKATGGPVVDYQAAMKRLANDSDLFREFVGFYDEDSPKLLAQIQEAIRSANAPQLERAAHSLKGLAANLGANGVVDVSSTLEEAGRARSLGNVAALLANLQYELSRLDDQLQQYRSA